MEDITGLDVTQYGRFGNNLIQLANAIFLAQGLGVQEIRCPELDWWPGDAELTYDGITIIPHHKPFTDSRFILTNDFYQLNWLSQDLQDTAIAMRYATIRQCFAPLFAGKVMPRSRDELVIHLRSGDIFEPKPHPAYWQPPLSFYQSVIVDLLEKKSIEKVCLVFEDRGNPCVDGVEQFLVSRGIPCRIQSASFDEDLATLLSASHLVYGHGTLGPCVVALKSAFSSLHIFTYGEVEDLPYADLVDEATVSTISPDKVKALGDWQYTAEQLDFMLSLPREEIIRRDLV